MSSARFINLLTTQDSEKVQTTWQKIYRKTTEKMEEQLVGTTAINLVEGEEGERGTTAEERACQ
jgi:hypothetical protein